MVVGFDGIIDLHDVVMVYGFQNLDFPAHCLATAPVFDFLF